MRLASNYRSRRSAEPTARGCVPCVVSRWRPPNPTITTTKSTRAGPNSRPCWAPTKTEPAMSDLLDALGVDLPDELLTLALTHRSYAYEDGGLKTNERLEFLGDAVLGLTVTDHLYHRHPERPESDLAKMRAGVVNTQALANVARGLTDQGLGAHLLLGRGELKSGGPDKSSILADSSESLLGAIYLQHGLDVARRVILRLFSELLEAGGLLDWKTSLQELAAARALGAVSYRVTATGPDHQREFTAVVVVRDAEYGSGIGRTKKEAEQKAAEQACQALKQVQ